MLIKSQALSELFFTTDTYSTFNNEDEEWFDESEFDNKGFMKDLADLHAQVINDCLPAGGIKSVSVISTSSPREYNFATDQVQLEIDVELEQLYRYLQMHDNEKEFEKFTKEHFTSYDGFSSWTPNNLKDFYETMEGESKEYDHEEDRDKCIGILAGWYLSRECLTEEEYLDEMYDGVRQVFYDNFTQFLPETWAEYRKYEEQFEQLSKQIGFEGIPPGTKYLMEIEEWFRDKNSCNDCDLGVTEYPVTEDGLCSWCERPKEKV